MIAHQKHIIPLPDPKAPVSHEFPVGSTVLALYPDTSCFYRAEVVATPKTMGSSTGSVCLGSHFLGFFTDMYTSVNQFTSSNLRMMITKSTMWPLSGLLNTPPLSPLSERASVV